MIRSNCASEGNYSQHIKKAFLLFSGLLLEDVVVAGGG